MNNTIYYIMQGSLMAVIELVGIAAAVGLYISDRRAKTEAEHYIYSPRYKPSVRTPKLAFIPLPLVATTLIATEGVMEIWQGHLAPVVSDAEWALIGFSGGGAIVALVMLVTTTRPVESQPTDSSSDDNA